MVEAAEHRKAITSRATSLGESCGRILVQALMGPGAIEIADVLGEHSEQMALAQCLRCAAERSW